MVDKPFAFVIMPFDSEFDPIYEELIRRVFVEVGYDVQRADDIESQQNILKDVVSAIHRSDLIVADLTSMNPNVFYELGLAHAFKKPVILITQSIEEVPFDLRSQRLLEYSVHFAKISIARDKLTGYAKRALKGSLQFGSPVTDFKSEADGHERKSEAETPSNDKGLAKGYLDHFIAINEGYNRIAEIVEGLTGDLQEWTESTESTNAQFQFLAKRPTATTPTAARSISRRLAKQTSQFTARLQQANIDYASIADDTEDSLEFIVSFPREHSEESHREIDEQLAALKELYAVVVEGRQSFLTLAGIMDEMPRIERQLDREIARASEEIRTMANNLDKTIASVSRALSDHI